MIAIYYYDLVIFFLFGETSNNVHEDLSFSEFYVFLGGINGDLVLTIAYLLRICHTILIKKILQLIKKPKEYVPQSLIKGQT